MSEKLNCGLPHNEKLLLEQVATGNQSSFRLLYDFYRESIYSVAVKALKSEDLAADAVQEIFIKVWTNKDKLPQINDFGAYLHVIARNHIYRKLNQLAREQISFRQYLHDEYSSEINPSLQLGVKELNASIQLILKDLSPQQQKVFRLSRLEGYKHAEIADILHLSKETVKKYLMDALVKVREKLQLYKSESLLLILAYCMCQLF
ncbi:MAG TPA: RNA polymerase sigma factor [Parasegetibacter sp.]